MDQMIQVGGSKLEGMLFKVLSTVNQKKQEKTDVWHLNPMGAMRTTMDAKPKLPNTTRVISLKWMSESCFDVCPTVHSTTCIFQHHMTYHCCTCTYTCMTLNPEKDSALSSLNGVHYTCQKARSLSLLKIA